MSKLTTWLKRIDNNILHVSFIVFIVAISLLPKFPVERVEYTYIKIRLDDFLPLILAVIFAIQFLRRKVKLNTKFLIPILVFWAAIGISFVYGYYFQNTIPVRDLALLHSLRRVQYMIVFFIASSIVVSEKRFAQYLKYYLITLFITCLYGLGQKFLQFPSVQSMNPAYVDGRLLFLKPEDRINSTFGGHFDLASYLTFSIPIVLGFYFTKAKKYFFGLFILSLTVLLYTAARSSFIAYIVSISAFILFLKKYRFYLLVMFLTAILLLITGDMTKRFQQTFQSKTVYINQQTGERKIDQKIRTDELPAGEFQIPFFKSKKIQGNEGTIAKLALEEALREAEKSGRKANMLEIQKRADEISKYIQSQKLVLCDIACATRLQLEWPRALGAFLYNPIVGSGPSAIGEATDNDYLRWLGELGLFGTLAFLYLLYAITKFVWNGAKIDSNNKYIYYGFSFGLLALLINSLYVDVFEASKMAYNFWLVSGLYVGHLITHEKRRFK